MEPGRCCTSAWCSMSLGCSAAKVHLNMDRTVGGAGRSHLAVLETGPALPRLRRRRGQAGATCFTGVVAWPTPKPRLAPKGDIQLMGYGQVGSGFIVSGPVAGSATSARPTAGGDRVARGLRFYRSGGLLNRHLTAI